MKGLGLVLKLQEWRKPFTTSLLTSETDARAWSPPPLFHIEDEHGWWCKQPDDPETPKPRNLKPGSSETLDAKP